MTMLFTAENSRRFYGGGGGGDQGDFGNFMVNDYGTNSDCIGGGSDLINISSSSRSPLILLMADDQDDESKTDQSTNNFIVNDDLQLGGGTANSESSSKNIVPEDEDHDEGWLQLSIGGGGRHGEKDHGPGGLVELELLPIPSSSSNNNSRSSHAHELISRMADEVVPQFRAPRPPLMNFATTTPTSGSGFIPSFFMQQQYPVGTNSNYSNFPQHQADHQINWANFRPLPISIGGTPSSSSSSSSISSMAPLAGGSNNYNYYYPGRAPFQLYPGIDHMGLMGPSSNLDFRVIPPPKRPHSGLWFMLQASQNQDKQPFLPQISKSYLRIKDGRMTIRVVMKYLVNKLTLQNESEIEIRCKGQRLVPFLTLQHVRDNIWSSSSTISTSRDNNFITLLPNSSTTDHIMVLHYARTTSSST